MSALLAFRTQTRPSWLADTGLPWVWGWAGLDMAENLVRLGSVPSLAYPLDVFLWFVKCYSHSHT